MIDQQSIQAHTEQKAKIKNDQISVLNLFRKMGISMTARQAYAAAKADQLSIDFAGLKSRITELTIGGLLRKTDKAFCQETKKTVNRWEFAIKGIPEDFFR